MDAPVATGDLYALLTDGIDAVLGVVSIYFSVLSAYIAALNFFLRDAPILMKLAAFAVLSGALAFIGLTIIGVERLIAGAIFALRDRVPLSEAPEMALYLGVDLMTAMSLVYPAAVAAGWALAFMLYGVLFYLTFVHRWPPRTS